MPYAETEQLGSTAPDQFQLFADLPEHLTGQPSKRISSPRSAVQEIEVRHWGGATARATDPGPVGHRQVPFSMTIARLPGRHGRIDRSRDRQERFSTSCTTPLKHDAAYTRSTFTACGNSSDAMTPTTCSGIPTTSRLNRLIALESRRRMRRMRGSPPQLPRV